MWLKPSQPNTDTVFARLDETLARLALDGLVSQASGQHGQFQLLVLLPKLVIIVVAVALLASGPPHLSSPGGKPPCPHHVVEGFAAKLAELGS